MANLRQIWLAAGCNRRQSIGSKGTRKRFGAPQAKVMESSEGKVQGGWNARILSTGRDFLR
jgi:hypothetical protein